MQNSDAYADRFDPKTYESENPVVVALSSQPLAEGLAIPSSVFYRLVALGHAYNLHILGQVLSWNEEQKLNASQCETLLDEIDLIAGVLDDALLRNHLPGLRDLVERAARSQGREELVLDLDT